uniref:DUF3782 domain-containing protein n=1 Tax=Thermoflexus sp. TaxID=1969742 RepID=UPI0035E3FC1E
KDLLESPKTLKRLSTRMGKVEQALQALTESVTALTEAQRRHYEEFAAYRAETEQRFAELREELAALQADTERRFAELREDVAAVRTEADRRFAELAEAIRALAEAQRRTEERLGQMEQRILRRLNAFGARWGLRSEAAWREGMRAVLKDVGFQVERWAASDPEGEVFGYPATVELDVVIRNGVRMVIELKTSVGREILPILERKVRFYEKRTGQSVQRRILVTPWYEPEVEEQARWMGWEIYGEPEEILSE